MLSEEIKKLLEQYIDDNYVKSEEIDNLNQYDEQLCKGSGRIFSDKDAVSLAQLVDGVGESFHEMLFRKIDSSEMSDVEVYKKANVDRKLFSKIRSNPAYHPRKQTVLALCIALELSLEETVDLLSRAEYALSPGSKGDLIVKFFIEQKIYDIQAINFALYEYDQETLG